MHRALIPFLFLIAASGLWLASCGGAADAVGAPCARNADCPGMRCLTGGKYPNGLCSYACDRNEDCPDYSVCIDRDGGVCLPLCDYAQDCREGYSCDSQRNRGTSGSTRVCIND
jgi:hypothetical protein